MGQAPSTIKGSGQRRKPRGRLWRRRRLVPKLRVRRQRLRARRPQSCMTPIGRPFRLWPIDARRGYMRGEVVPLLPLRPSSVERHRQLSK